MECLFELPVEARLGRQFTEGFYRKIEDKEGNAICLVVDFEKSPYIVQAINSHEKLKTFIKTLNKKAQFAQIPNYVLIRECEHALKESEK